MEFKVKHILEGIKNSIFVKEEVEKIANERYAICKECPKLSSAKDDSQKGPYYNKLRPDEHCTVCACNIHAKVRSLHTECPIGKWGPVANESDSAEIMQVIINNDPNKQKDVSN